ncbi:type III secretion protein [Alcaligenes sp. WGS1538]|uniref:type III secretion protein n=1 Tax=Alcaligenes sp. WGS1538 TaxID=3366811 RepID=UPI00372D6C09
MSIFQDLLAIKRFREGQAELAVMRQRQSLLQMQQRSAEAREQLARFRELSLQREQDMYQDLCSRLVRVGEIEDVLDGVAELRQGEREREAGVEQAAEQEREATAALNQCRDMHREASRVVQKFVELTSVHAAEHLRELERKEDLEMEEAASMARDRDDWQLHDDYEPA